MKTKLEIINETVEYYSEDVSRRATNDKGRCEYYINGKMCAFGRCMINPQFKYVSDDPTLGIKNVDQDPLLKKEYRGHENEFWVDLQNLHDNQYHWDKGGLTEFGQKYVEKLKKKWH